MYREGERYYTPLPTTWPRELDYRSNPANATQRKPKRAIPVYAIIHTMSKTAHQPRRLLIFQETRNPHNSAELVFQPVNKLGLPLCGDGPDLPSILELPLRILKACTEIFNQPKFKGWYVFLCLGASIGSRRRGFSREWITDGVCLGLFSRRVRITISPRKASTTPLSWSRYRSRRDRWMRTPGLRWAGRDEDVLI